jgi:hypothetical protein
MTSYRPLLSLFSWPALLFLGTLAAFGQAGSNAPDPAPDPTTTQSSQTQPAPLQPGQTEQGPPPPDKRIFGVLPNYRTANATAVYMPITPKQKLTIASKDSFDYPLIGLAAVLAAEQQLANTNPSFGQGMAGYGRRVGVEYADQAIGNMMTEGFFPILLHEDPRYFRRGYGSVWSRTFYAATRVFVTRTDSGGTRFNFSEILGNAAGTAISNAYTPDQRDVGDNLQTWWTQIGIDSASQVLKEFWPDIKHKLFHGPDPNPQHAAELSRP